MMNLFLFHHSHIVLLEKCKKNSPKFILLLIILHKILRNRLSQSFTNIIAIFHKILYFPFNLQNKTPATFVTGVMKLNSYLLNNIIYSYNLNKI